MPSAKAKAAARAAEVAAQVKTTTAAQEKETQEALEDARPNMGKSMLRESVTEVSEQLCERESSTLHMRTALVATPSSDMSTVNTS
jgi:hypothetical protein